MNQQKEINTPIVLIGFNRPEKIRQVFEQIKKVEPKKLYLVVDGPRDGHPKDLEKIKEVKQIIENIDWDCEVKKNYAEKNLGCKKRINTGLDWVFKTEEKAIILEDDCLPNEDFFFFCQELLDKYQDDSDIMMISGDNFQKQNKKNQCQESYYFSKIANIWGWATWKRAWSTHDQSMSNWPSIKKNKILKKYLPSFAIREYWENLLDNIYQNKNKKTDTWDAQWFLTVLQNGLSISPSKNLVSNIGFDAQATRSKTKGSPLENITRERLTFPLTHPQSKKINSQADLFTYRFVYRINNTTKKKIKSFLRHYFSFIYFSLKKIIKK